ncbi:MAG TPA: hypothetical protein VF546_02985 [Pyrinomonadaceae bacterium]|jgi:hypothetical protein
MSDAISETGRATRATNLALVRFLLLPTVFLTVAALGGVRVAAGTRALVFLPPPLVTLILAAMLLLLFVRGRLFAPRAWLTSELPARVNVAHALTLVTLFFASAQAFNCVLPERGLPRWLFSFFFLWTLWQGQFAPPGARRLLRSLAALFATAFALKHMLLAALYAPEGNWLRRLAGALVEGLTQGTLGDAPAYAPATGYLAFFTLALYVGGLVLVALVPPPWPDAPRVQAGLLDYRQLTPAERALIRAELDRAEAAQLSAAPANVVPEPNPVSADE